MATRAPGVTETTGEPGSGARRPSITSGEARRVGVIAVLVLLVLFLLPAIVSDYYVDTSTQVVTYSIVALGLGLLVGRVGLVSLGQAAVLALGAWVAARLLFGTGLPFELVLLLSGLITMVLGTLVGLPALRMRGLYLALITLMLAGAITVVLATTNFPNGGHGFLGYNGSSVHIPAIRRPGIAATDPAFFRYSVIVALLMFALVLAHLRGRPGRAWAAIRQSESSALAAGINTTFYKLWAFALASFITGVAGGLLANSWGVSADWLTILFGIGVLQVLTTAPRGVVDQLPKDMARLGRLIWRTFGRTTAVKETS
jgi:branched-chain amino acid transport system permease protein